MKEHTFHYSPIALAVIFSVSHSQLFAKQHQMANDHSAVLDEVVVTESHYAHERQNEVTGLGKVVKNYHEMSKNQILGIRDLTRYDPGISVVEQGRGASSGYAIRGVDKNRVSLLVDGLPQAQHYHTLGSDANGGAINEIEYENIRSIELSKGASSAEYGSGALGGAIGFRTKDAQDIIKEGQHWGLDSKTSYASKNSHFLQSIAAAGEAGGFEALVIATHRHGKETKIHSEANKLKHNIRRITGFENRYDLYPDSTQNAPGGSFFIVEDTCPTLDCTPRARPKLNRDNFPVRTFPEYTPEERKQLEQIPYRTEQLSAQEYTGKDRIAPNPLDYKSNSVFMKFGYHFNSSHYLGAILEDTKQRYDIRDMQTPAYYTKDDINIRVDNLSRKNSSVYEGDNILDGLVFDRRIPYGLRYSHVKFFDERHHKRRLGFTYKYKPENNRWLDSIKLSADKQDIELYSRLHRLHCSDYPVVDKNCRPTLDKSWSMYRTERNNYQEKHRVIHLEFDKALNAGQGVFKQTHKLNLGLGFDRFNSLMDHGDITAQYTKGGYTSYRGRGRLDDPYIYRRNPRSIETVSLCNNTHGDIINCEPRKIKGGSHFVSFRDLITSEYVDLGLGVRFDQHRFKSDDPWTLSRTYRNWSWNGGITLKPTEFMSLSYRISNGFRVPAFYELYGKRDHIGLKDNEYVQREQRSHQLEPEKSTNHEIGVSFKGQFGYLDVSYFRNNYKNMIATACKRIIQKSHCFSNYHNIQDVALNGINLVAKFDLHGILSMLPDGFYSSVAYNRVKVKERKLNDSRLDSVNDPILDAIQPARYVLGFGYDHPEEKWGIGITTTYSKAKNADEVVGTRHHGIYRVDLGGKLTGSWYTHDITGYINYKNYTLRGGIYNVTNRKYSTWESVRQSGVNAVNQDRGSNYTRFAAPGRNFSLALEMKF